MITKQSTFPILGMLFHPMYMLVNAQILGNLQLDQSKCGSEATHEMLQSLECVSAETYLASFGLASATMGIFLLAPGCCFNQGLLNILPQAYGAKNYQLCWAYLNRFIFATIIIFVPFLIPMSFVEYVFLYMN
jgi:Na+-driven multidrug efflux pump